MTESSIKHLQILSFHLADECFGAEISQIQEVIEYKRVTKVPNTPEYMLGVINLRGQVIPVVDLRIRFNMIQKEATVDSCIIIVELDFHGEIMSVGILADKVKEVVELDYDAIEPAPKIGNTIDNQFIYGLVHNDEEIIILLRLLKLFEQPEVAAMMATEEAEDEPS